MGKIAERLKTYIDTHPIDVGEGDCETVLEQFYQAYTESHESGPPEIRDSMIVYISNCVLPFTTSTAFQT